ncbi:MAG TPA: hypothetical protein VFX76_10780, partial [Roseiflexaceae bacterium]|nr:hypothetical protein [Roseiflexaceae bacterium]
ASGIGALPAQLLIQAQEGEAADITVALPMQTTNNLSIMATLEGTSELAPHYGGSNKERKDDEWANIIEHYKWLARPTKPLSGPGRLPLPLPRIRAMDMLTAQSQQRGDLVLMANALPAELRANDQSTGRIQVNLKRYWLYVVQHDLHHIEQVIAQGSPDIRFLDNGFPLLGAKVGDTVVLVGTGFDDQPVVYNGTIAGYRPNIEHNNRLEATIAWQEATPKPFPVIDVVSDIELPDLQRNPEAMARISVQVSSGDTGTSLPEAIEVRIFPRVFAPGQNHTISSSLERDDTRSTSSQWISQVYEVPALDGHVLVRLGDTLTLSTFSHGGHPPSSGPFAPVPAPSISAGSSDGAVMLVFYHDQGAAKSGVSPSAAEQYSKIKVVTMIDNGARGTLASSLG